MGRSQLFSTLKDREVRHNLLYFVSQEVDPEGNMSSLSAFTLRGNDSISVELSNVLIKAPSLTKETGMAGELTLLDIHCIQQISHSLFSLIN